MAAAAAAAVALCLGACDHNAIAAAQARYAECLERNPSAPDLCQGLRRAHESELYELRIPPGVRSIVRRR